MTRIVYPGGGLFVDYDHLVTGEVRAVRENGAITGLLGRYSYDRLGRRTQMPAFGISGSTTHTMIFL